MSDREAKLVDFRMEMIVAECVKLLRKMGPEYAETFLWKECRDMLRKGTMDINPHEIIQGIIQVLER